MAMVLEKVGSVVCAHCGTKKTLQLVHSNVKCLNCGSESFKTKVVTIGMPYEPKTHISRRPHAIDRRQRGPI